MKTLITACILVSAQYWCGAQTNLPGLDPSFGNNGIILDSINSGIGDAHANDVLVQPDGKIVSAGSTLNRYFPSGKPDSTFGKNGSTALAAIAIKVLLQSNGKLLAIADGHNTGFAMRFKANGQYDSTFGKDGIVETYHYYINCFALQPDGKLLVAGLTDYDSLAINRYNQDGTADSSFGSYGRIATFKGGSGGNVAGIGTLPDGRIVIGGVGRIGLRSAMMLRYLPNGQLDTSLNHTGIAVAVVADYCRAMLLQPDGKVLLALSPVSRGDGQVLRLKLDGTIDSTYGHNGFATIPTTLITAMQLMLDNRLVCGGVDEDFVVARLKADGVSLDSAFGVNGIARTNIGDEHDIIGGIAIQHDGKIIAAGRTEISSISAARLTIVRYLQNAQTGIPSPPQMPITISPNPVEDVIEIDHGKADLNRASYRILSIEGRLVRSGRLGNNKGRLNVSALAPGNYLLHISTASTSYTQKFAKM